MLLILVRIAADHFDGLVAGDLLNRRDVNARIYQVRNGGVSQRVSRDAPPSQTRALDNSSPRLREVLRMSRR